MFIAKYDNNGNFVWFNTVPSPYTKSYPLNAIAAYDNDVIAAVGENSRELTFGSLQFSPTNTNAFIATLGTINVVTTPLTSISIDPSSLILEVGGTGSTLTATILPTDASNTNVTWTTSDSNVAIVNSTGFVTPVGAGIATITATTVDGGYTANCSVTVNAPIITSTNDWTRLLSYGGIS